MTGGAVGCIGTLEGEPLENVIMILVIGFIVFEFIEHVIFPLFWYIKNRKKRSICGVTGMLGKVADTLKQ